MLAISDLASMELMIGFQVPGICVMATTSSSLAWAFTAAGEARAPSARIREKMRRIMSAAP